MHSTVIDQKFTNISSPCGKEKKNVLKKYVASELCRQEATNNLLAYYRAYKGQLIVQPQNLKYEW